MKLDAESRFVILIASIFLIHFWLAIFITQRVSYKAGQIDAITNKIMYEKVIHEDQTLTWETKEK